MLQTVEIVLSHKKLKRSVTVHVDRSLVAAAGNPNSFARTKLVMTFKEAYTTKYRHKPGFLPAADLRIREVIQPTVLPVYNLESSCDCGCAGCDQDRHCHKGAFDCYK